MPQLSTTLTRFSGAFNFTNSYRGPPSPEIDAAWDRYDSFRKYLSQCPLVTRSFMNYIAYEYASNTPRAKKRHPNLNLE